MELSESPNCFLLVPGDFAFSCSLYEGKLLSFNLRDLSLYLVREKRNGMSYDDYLVVPLRIYKESILGNTIILFPKLEKHEYKQVSLPFTVIQLLEQVS